jgi:hypothetical protein
MPMEQDTMGMLIGSFSIIMRITFIIVLSMLFSCFSVRPNTIVLSHFGYYKISIE